MKWRNLLIALLLVGLIGWVVYDNIRTKDDASTPPAAEGEIVPGVNVGDTAVDFTLTTLDGQTVKLSDYRGKKVLLNFWATWCPPCKVEMPHMEKFYKDYQDKQVVILGVNLAHTESSVEDVQRFVKNYGLTFPIVSDEKGKISSRYQVVAYPTSYVIDSQGVIRNKFQGAINEEMMIKTFKALK